MDVGADKTAAMPKQQDPSETIEEFKKCVNMDVKELQKWLKTKESNEVSPCWPIAVERRIRPLAALPHVTCPLNGCRQTALASD